MDKIFERLKASFKAAIVPRGHMSKTGQNVCFALALVGLILFYTYLAYQDSNTLCLDPQNDLRAIEDLALCGSEHIKRGQVFPRWMELWEGLRRMVYNPALEESILWEDSVASFSRLVPAILVSGVIGVVLGLYMGLYVAAAK